MTTIPETIPPKDSEIEALQRNVLTLFQQIVAGSPTLSDELSTVAMNIEERDGWWTLSPPTPPTPG